jgi:hypothetical protein
MTDSTPEDLHDEDIPAESVIEEPDPEEYEPGETTRAVSPATGTEYDETGEPALTAHDVGAPEEEL